MRRNPHRGPVPTGLLLRSALQDAAYALLHGEQARTEHGAVLRDLALERGITALPERGTRPGPLLAAWLLRDRRRLRAPVPAARRGGRRGPAGDGDGTRHRTDAPPSPRPVHVSPPTAADLRARLLWALERWLPPLPERRMPTMKRRNPKPRSIEDRAMLMYRAMLRQEAAEGAHAYGHGGKGLTPEYLAESNRLRGVSHGTRLKIAALNQQMGRGMATTSTAYHKWEQDRGVAPVRRNPRGLAGWHGETIPGVTGKVYTRETPHGRYRVYFAPEGFSRAGSGEWQAIYTPNGGKREFVLQHGTSAEQGMRDSGEHDRIERDYLSATRGVRRNPSGPAKVKTYRAPSAINADAETLTSADGTRRALGRNVKMPLGNHRYDVVRTWTLKERQGGKWATVDTGRAEAEAARWVGRWAR